MHVPGTLNPADIATRATAQPEDVMQGSMWQNSPDYLLLPRTEWPLSRNFLDYVPDQELRTSRAVFNVTCVDEVEGALGAKFWQLMSQVMDRSNCLDKVVNVTARLLKCLFGSDRNIIKEPLQVRDISAANHILFTASMGPTLVSL